jgi:hypothetical protein
MATPDPPVDGASREQDAAPLVDGSADGKPILDIGLQPKVTESGLQGFEFAASAIVPYGHGAY